jgi:hypothetical protein
MGVKLGHELYRWHAFADERVLLLALREEIVDAGATLVHTGIRADSLRMVIEVDDHALAERQRTVERYNRFADRGILPSHLWSSFQADLTDYRQLVGERNQRFEEWSGLVAAGQAAAERYDLLADSARRVAGRMGDPYFPIPVPAEAAQERGIGQPRAPVPADVKGG